MQSPLVKGKPIDDQTRCVHYHSALDIIALKFKCCGEYYPCYYCHEETAGHAPERWSLKEWDQRAVLCGVCKHELSVNEYLHCNYACPNCNAAFNPRCHGHNHLYFETVE